MENNAITNASLDYLYNVLTQKAQMANKDITREMMVDWVGNPGFSERQIDFMAAAFFDLVEGEYTAEQMVEDILQLTYLDN